MQQIHSLQIDGPSEGLDIALIPITSMPVLPVILLRIAQGMAVKAIVPLPYTVLNWHCRMLAVGPVQTMRRCRY